MRIDKSRNSKTGRTGLGLAIVWKITEAHGGKVKLKTGENKGSEFTITIPKI